MSVLFKGYAYTVNDDPSTRYHILILRIGLAVKPLIHQYKKIKFGSLREETRPRDFSEAVKIDFRENRLWLYDENGDLLHRSGEKIAAVLMEDRDRPEGVQICSPNTKDRKPNDERWREKSKSSIQMILELVGRDT